MSHLWVCGECGTKIPAGSICLCLINASQGWIGAAARWNDDLFAAGLPLHGAAHGMGLTERDRIFLKQLRIQP